ncbi:MAG: hypothetical protein ACYTF6_13115, partial [Planctomycetota bacterium]
EGRKLLLEHVRTKLLPDVEAVKAAGLKDCLKLIQVFSKDLSEQARAQWAAKLYSTYENKAAALESLGVGGCGLLAQMLKQLGSEDGAKILPMWVELVGTWRSWELKQLAGLAGTLSRLGDAGKKARAMLSGHVSSKFLTDPAAIKETPLGTWQALASNLKAELSAEQKASWATKLRSAYAPDDEALASMALGQCRALAGLLGNLGCKDAAEIVTTWMEANKSWRAWKLTQLIWLDRSLAQLGDAGKAPRARLLEHIEGKFVADSAAARSVGCDQWWDIAQYFAQTLPPPSRRQWVVALRQAYVDDSKTFAKLKSTEVIALSKALEILGDKESKNLFVGWLSQREAASK